MITIFKNIKNTFKIFWKKRKDKIILTTLSPDTHRTSEENLGLSYLTAVLRKEWI